MISLVEERPAQETDETPEEAIQVPERSEEMAEQSRSGHEIAWPFFI